MAAEGIAGLAGDVDGAAGVPAADIEHYAERGARDQLFMLFLLRSKLPDAMIAPYSPSSLASTPFTARAHPASFRSRVAWLIAGLKRCCSRQLSANFAGSG
jgi:hypothetical protein